ncbi:hypothetical protein ND748_30560, partial [Frankia sp. AiPs1]|nr:hypothetical protein [Frankia sp. AiPs1]
MTALPRLARPAWVVLAEEVVPLPADATLGQRVAPLLRNLALAAGAGEANLWLPEDPAPEGSAFPPEGAAASTPWPSALSPSALSPTAPLPAAPSPAVPLA